MAEKLVPHVSFPMPKASYAVSAPDPATEHQWTSDARRYAEEAVKQFANAGFDSEMDVVLGHSLSRMLDVISRLSADLVVVGSRGVGPADTAILRFDQRSGGRDGPATLIGRA